MSFLTGQNDKGLFAKQVGLWRVVVHKRGVGIAALR